MKTDAMSSLAADFMLAVYLDGQGRVPSYFAGLDFGLSGAILMELALDGFIQTADGYIVAVHAAGPRDRILGEIHAEIRASRRPRTASEWVRALSASAHRRLSAGLIADGVLVRTPRRLPSPTGSARRYDIRRGQRRHAAVRPAGAAADSFARLAALAATASACGAATDGRQRSEYEAESLFLSPACTEILTAVADCVWLQGLSSWT
ncbi:GPP34 family phosphoprotein [Streptomyces sp. NPDC101455]|uniref:GOLPH3/VPS74 family protein n=1 Tax=Streptomyces sp. NPDC101455 TaxID=3366142 RepID=UPI0038049311